MLVIFGHTYANLLPDPPLTPIHDPAPGADLGVDIFFSLSGFLITALLLNEHSETTKINFGNFYVRRALRLLPALIAVLMATTAYSLIANEEVSLQLGSILPVLFYLSNWMPNLGIGISPFLSHTWSLAVEEQFYLVWPALVALSFRFKASLSWVIAGVFALSILYRFVTWNENLRLGFYISTVWRADPLLFGALGAFLWTRGLTPKLGGWAWAAVGFITYCVIFQPVGGAFYFLGGFASIGVATTVIIIAAVDGEWSGSKILAWGPLRTVGLVSYGIYLWHLPVFVAVQQQMLHQSELARLVVGYLITAVLVTASWFVIERPFLALKPGRHIAPGPPTIRREPSTSDHSVFELLDVVTDVDEVTLRSDHGGTTPTDGLGTSSG